MGWLAGWSYRKEVTLIEQSSAAYNDLPTIITAAYDAHMKTDFADCRFTESDGSTLIAYGIKTKTDEVECEFVIKRDYTSGASLTVYLYYGNAAASDASVVFTSWCQDWYINNGFGKNPSAHHGSGACTIYDHSETDDIPSWPEHVFGGCTANGGYRSYFGHVKINGTGAKWASDSKCLGRANALKLRWDIYNCSDSMYDHASFVKDASNTVQWGHYSGGNTGFWVSWYPAEPSVSFGAEEEPSDDVELLAKFEVSQGFSELYSEFVVNQWFENLLGEFTVNQSSADLLGNAEIQNSGSAELLCQFEAQAVADLLGKFEVKNIGSADLLGRFEAQGVAELLGEAVIKNTGSADLLGNVVVNKGSSTDLLGNVEVQQSGSAELLGNVDVRQSGSAELLSTLRVTCPRLMGENWQRKMWFDGTYYWRGRYDSIGDELIFEYIASAGLAGNTWTKNAAASISGLLPGCILADFTVRGGDGTIPTTIHYSDGFDSYIAESDEASATGWAWQNNTKVFDATTTDCYRRVNLAANRTTPTPRLWVIAVFSDDSEGKQWVKARRQTTGGVITGWDAEVDVSDVDNLNIIFGCSVRSMGEAGAGKNDIMVVYKEGDALRSVYYTGSWQTIQDIDTATLSGHSAFDFEHGEIAGMDMAHLLYLDENASVQWRERGYGGASVWSAASQLHAADVGHHSVGIVEHGSGWLWAAWDEGDLIEYRSHDCNPETWYPPLASDPLTFDVSTEAVVDTSTTAQLQTPDFVPSGEAVPICWIGETAPTTPCDVGWGILVEYSIASLKGVFDVRQPSSVELLGKFDVGQDSAELLARFEAQSVADLLGKFEAQGVVDLLGKFDVGQDSEDLLGRFEAQGVVDLLGKFDVGQDSEDLLGRFVAQGVADLLGRFEAQGVADLLGNVEVQQSGSAELLSGFEAQGVADLLAKFEAQATVELLGEFVVNQWQEDLYAKFRISCPRLMGSNWQRKMWYDGTYYWRSRYDPVGLELIFEYLEADGLENNVWAKNAAASIDASGFSGIDADFTVRGGDGTIPTTIHYSDGIDTWIAESDEASLTGWVWENTTMVFDGTDPDWYRSPNLCSDQQGAPKLWATAVFYDSGKQWVKASLETASGNITGWDAAVNVSNVDNTNPIYGESIRSMGAAAGVDVMAVYKEGAALRSRYYDGDWDDVIEDIDTSTLVGKSEWDFEHGDTPKAGHVLYVDANSSVQWRERDAGAASVWGAAEQVGADTSHTHRGVGIIEHGSGWLWATWANEDTVEVEYRLHLCSPEIWMPLLVNDPLTFDVTNAEVPTSTISQLQTPDSQPAGSAVILTWIGETTPTTPCAAGWGIIIPRCHEDLLGKFDVGQNSADLLGRFVAQGIADLLGKFEAQGVADLLGKFEAQGVADLLAKFEAQGVVDLLGKFDVGQDSQELLGKFEAQGVADLLARFEAQGVADLLGKFETQGVADLLGKFDVGQDSQNLLANVEIQQSGPAELLGNVEVQQLEGLDLISNFYVSPSYLTADEMLIGGRDRRMDLGGLDREMVVGGRDRRMKIK